MSNFSDTMVPPLEQGGAVLPLPLEGWLVGVAGVGFVPVKGRMANAREILDWEPPENLGKYCMATAMNVAENKMDHVLVDRACGRACQSHTGTVMFIPESKPDEMWQVTLDRFFVDHRDCVRACEEKEAALPSIREILACDPIKDGAEDQAASWVAYHVPRAGHYQFSFGGQPPQTMYLTKGQTINHFGPLGPEDYIREIPGDTMQTAYELNINKEEIRSVSVNPPYSVGADGGIQMEGNPHQVFPVFSDAKKALIKHLVAKKAGVQQQITAARKLTRGQLEHVPDGVEAEPQNDGQI